MASSSAGASPKPDQYADPAAVSPDQLAFLPHDNAGPKLNGVIWALTALSGLILGLRVYCRLSRRKGLWWDDGFLIAAWVSMAGPERTALADREDLDLHHDRVGSPHSHDRAGIWSTHLGLRCHD